MELNRRGFMKMCGLAALAPSALAGDDSQFILELPGAVWNAESGECREIGKDLYLMVSKIKAYEIGRQYLQANRLL